MTGLLLVGTSHRLAPVELRERLALDDVTAIELTGRLAVALGEAVALSTCNRVCLYVASDGAEPAREQTVAELVALSGLPRAGPRALAVRQGGSRRRLFTSSA